MEKIATSFPEVPKPSKTPGNTTNLCFTTRCLTERKSIPGVWRSFIGVVCRVVSLVEVANAQILRPKAMNEKSIIHIVCEKKMRSNFHTRYSLNCLSFVDIAFDRGGVTTC